MNADLKEISPNSTVRIFKKSKTGNWRRKGKVISTRSEPRSYNVLNEKGHVVRRNRSQLLPTNERFNPSSSSSEYDTDDEREIENPDTTEITENSNTNEIPVVPQNLGDTEPPDTHETIGNYVTRFGRTIRSPDRLGY